MSIDKFLFRKYNRKKYNCAHLVAEVWQELTGRDISRALQGFLRGQGETTAILSELRAFRRLPAPKSPCIALFTAKRLAPHVGIYIKGKVLHIQRRGVEYQPVEIASEGFRKTRFYTC